MKLLTAVQLRTFHQTNALAYMLLDTALLKHALFSTVQD
jgi:hypothetical protein